MNKGNYYKKKTKDWLEKEGKDISNKLFSVKEIASYFKLSKEFFYLNKNKLPYYKIGGRYFFKIDEVRNALNALKIERSKKLSEVLKRQWMEGKRKPTIPRKLLDKVCPICKKIFRPKHNYNIYCSKKCAGLAKRKGEYVQCDFCGKTIYRKPYSLRRAKNYFCSHKCADKFHSISLFKKFKEGKMKKFYISGRRYEKMAMDELRKNEGCQIVVRSPQSRGIFDVFGIKIEETGIVLYLIQVKSLKIKNRNISINLLGKKEISKIIHNIKNETFPCWRGNKLKGYPKWAKQINFEIWIFRKYDGWYKFRLDLENGNWVQREPEIIEVEKILQNSRYIYKGEI